MEFEEAKNKYLNMNLEEKRSGYFCKTNFVTLENIPTWVEYSAKVKKKKLTSAYKKDERLNKKVSIFVGDITVLEIDVIVNAADPIFLGCGGVNGAIHEAAGKFLRAECVKLNGFPPGEAKITGGYKLPSKYVIHTAGPIREKPDILTNCYFNSLNLAQENGLKTIAFPCISTGLFEYPNQYAAEVALKTVREYLEKNEASMDRVIFCLFLSEDVAIYESLMQRYFPI
ncbi:ADP-ribose glycohydrolase MACROD1 [Nephila pilipes]|uniref:ADP-ribose glycohydrolase MACROD1 n=1 Tax=Nephila pilipes TaxID=299642 RepID=A0A8X6UBJ8_NEPPI|nr:ADP-ribose glycohydrolase MACROD1 [Nephila pilipes]